MSDKPRKFWMVKGRGPSTAPHHNRNSAENEARRLARENPGIPFFVMEAVAYHHKVDVERVAFDGYDEDGSIPF